jgi:NADPH-dependent curcumin reductase CurA
VTVTNTQCRLAARPIGLPTADDWTIGQQAVPTACDGEFVVAVDYLSVDPAMRAWMNAGDTYVPAIKIGEVMRPMAIGTVVESRHNRFSVGDQVSGMFGVQNYAVSNGDGVSKVDTAMAPAPVHLGALGISGLTAYFGLLDIGRPQPGQTVLVSGAAGSVGSIAGQIARIKGCRTIGIAGGEHKCCAQN